MRTSSVLWLALLCLSDQAGAYLSIARQYQQSRGYSSRHETIRAATTAATSPQPSSSSDTDRLRKARLRLAEAQGILPIGASDIPGMTLEAASQGSSRGALSKVREISWRVAEPSVKYDPINSSKTLFAQPLKWISRNIQFTTPVFLFAVSVILDIVTDKEEANRPKRAKQLLDIVSVQSPALIKAGQALASRSDLLPREYLDALQKLQDRCPAYPTELAEQLFERELGKKFNDVFELEFKEPVAAASIGQVYKGVLRSNGAKVAIKIQRPNCEDAIATDLYILRFYASVVQQVLALLRRDINLVSVIDDFGELIYREIDYRAEAVNAQRFAELYASIPNIFVPKVYTDLSTSKVLTMEWVDGYRLTDREAIDAMGLDSSKFVDTLVQCSLRQMLENGFYHADPHLGNLLAMPSGQLCYLDFGMVSYVESQQRYSIIEAVVHLVNRDFVSLASLYKRIGFIPNDVDSQPIIQALESALPDVLNAAVGELNFKNVIEKLGDVMYKFPFSLPPFYISIIRCLGVLEGLAIQVDKDFRIISDAYPYIASRLLTDPSKELQAALQQLLFENGKPRWERLQELLEKAASTTDYDVTVAAEQLLKFVVSEQGGELQELVVQQGVTTLDQLAVDLSDLGLGLLASPASLSQMIEQLASGRGDGLSRLVDAVLAQPSNGQRVLSSSSLASSSQALRFLFTSVDNKTLDTDKVVAVLRRVSREPAAQRMLARIASELTERAAQRAITRLFRTAEVQAVQA